MSFFSLFKVRWVFYKNFHGLGDISIPFSLIITIPTPISVIEAPKIILKLIVSSKPSNISKWDTIREFIIANIGTINVKGVIFDTSYRVIKR